MTKLSAITAAGDQDKVKTFDVAATDVDDGPRIKGVWSPSRLTGRMVQDLLDDQSPLNLATAIIAIIREWDLTNDDDSPYELTIENVMALPIEVQATLLQNIQRSVTPDPKEPSTFAGS